jgi:parvulin-like peptidyl-prolyl isomerase
VEIRQIFYANALQEKVREALFGKPKDEEEQVKVRHILVATEDQAKDVMIALQKGESFANLAKSISTDTGSGAQGGDLGWAQKGAYVTEFEETVWSDKTKPGDVLGPIKTQFGFHIIQLEARETRALTEEQKSQGADKKFQDWLTAQATEKKATKFEYWSERVPNTPTLDQLGLPSAGA